MISLGINRTPWMAMAGALALLACDRGRGEQQPRPPSGSAVAAPAAAAPAAPVDLAGHRTTYDLVGNRVHAIIHEDGVLRIATDGPDFLKYVDGGWKTSWILGEKDGGTQAAFVNTLSASFFVPLDTDGDGPFAGKTPSDVKLAITMRATVPNQRVSVFANEKSVGALDVPTTVGRHELVVPASALSTGENRFRLTFRAAGDIGGGKRSAAAIHAIEVGPANAPAPAAPRAAPSAARELSSARPSRLSFYVQVPTGAKLALSHRAPGAGTSVVVRVARDGAAPTVLHEGASTAQPTSAVLDLAPYAEHAVRIDLVSRGGGVAWVEPRLVVKAAPAAPPAPRKVERIYVWMVDTLRADKLRVYNPKSAVTTRNYDAFAADATRFAWAHVPGTWSLPSHASILTGVYPTVHKATAHEAKLSRDVAFVAELVKKAGYKTALFSSNGYISGKWGFDRGWDHSRNFIRESLPNGAEYLWKTAKAWVTANDGKPQFVYLATVEPHVIYNPKKEFLQKYWSKPYTGPIKPTMTGIQLGHIKSGKLKVNDTDKKYLEALYDAEVEQSDAAFGAFLADLKAAGVYDKSAVIVVSDHGDEFWEHGDVGHAQGVHQELVHIPLIIRAPGVFPAGKVVKSDVEAMDVCPTILEMAGVPIPDKLQGQSLVGIAHDEVGFYPGVGLSLNQAIVRGMKVGRYRFIHAGMGRLGLYDQIKDPLEQQDLGGKLPIALRQMRNVFGLLYAYEARWNKRAWGNAANVGEGFYRAVRGS